MTSFRSWVKSTWINQKTLELATFSYHFYSTPTIPQLTTSSHAPTHTIQYSHIGIFESLITRPCQQSPAPLGFNQKHCEAIGRITGTDRQFHPGWNILNSLFFSISAQMPKQNNRSEQCPWQPIDSPPRVEFHPLFNFHICCGLWFWSVALSNPAALSNNYFWSVAPNPPPSSVVFSYPLCLTEHWLS